MKISLVRLSTKDLATLAQRIINNIQSGKYPVISNHPLTATLQTSYNEYDLVYTKQIMKDVPGWELLYSDMNKLVKAAKNSDIKPQQNNNP